MLNFPLACWGRRKTDTHDKAHLEQESPGAIVRTLDPDSYFRHNTATVDDRDPAQKASGSGEQNGRGLQPSKITTMQDLCRKPQRKSSTYSLLPTLPEPSHQARPRLSEFDLDPPLSHSSPAQQEPTKIQSRQKVNKKVDRILGIQSSFLIDGSPPRVVTYDELESMEGAFEALYQYVKQTPPPQPITITRLDLPSGRAKSARFISDRNKANPCFWTWQALVKEPDGLNAANRYCFKPNT